MGLHTFVPDGLDASIQTQASNELICDRWKTEELIIEGIVKNVTPFSAEKLSANLNMRPQRNALVGDSIPRFTERSRIRHRTSPPEEHPEEIDSSMRDNPEQVTIPNFEFRDAAHSRTRPFRRSLDELASNR